MVPSAVGLIAITFGLARYGYGLLLPDMRDDLGMGAATAGLIGSSAYVSYLLANVVVVPMTARWGPRIPLAAATVTACSGMALVAGARDVTALAAGVLLAGSGAGFAFPPYADVVARAVAPERRTTAWAAISSGTGWGVALAGPVAVISAASWRWSWSLFAVIGLVVGALAVASVPPDRGATGGPVVRLRPAWFVCPRSGPLLAGAVLVGAGSSVWWAFSVDAMRAAGLDATTSRLLYALCGVAGVVASLTGSLVRRAGQRRVHQGSVLAVAVSLLLLAVSAMLDAPHLSPLLVASGLFGISYNAVIAVQGMWNADVFSERPSAGLAAVNAALTAGTLLGPAVGGAVIELFGYGPALVGAAGVSAVAFVLAPPAGPHGLGPRDAARGHRAAGALLRRPRPPVGIPS